MICHSFVENVFDTINSTIGEIVEIDPKRATLMVGSNYLIILYYWTANSLVGTRIMACLRWMAVWDVRVDLPDLGGAWMSALIPSLRSGNNLSIIYI